MKSAGHGGVDQARHRHEHPAAQEQEGQDGEGEEQAPPRWGIEAPPNRLGD